MNCALRDKTVLKEFLRYVPFSVLAMIAMSCYILADTYFISQGLGTYGLSALNLAIRLLLHSRNGADARNGRRNQIFRFKEQGGRR